MRYGSWIYLTVAAVSLLLVLLLPSASLGAAASLGPRAGYDFDSDQFVLGGEAEFGRVLQYFRLAPSIDLEFGDHTATALNGDLRLYLFHLPETGLHFYGSGGPTLLLADSLTELGLSLVAGLKIPMKGRKRYNVETRFGLGDIPEFKLMLAVIFGI